MTENMTENDAAKLIDERTVNYSVARRFIIKLGIIAHGYGPSAARLESYLKQVIEALEGLRCAPLFHGYRGKPRCDLHAAADTVLAIAAFAEDNLSTIAELDVNPLLLLAEGRGVVAADALISMYTNN